MFCRHGKDQAARFHLQPGRKLSQKTGPRRRFFLPPKMNLFHIPVYILINGRTHQADKFLKEIKEFHDMTIQRRYRKLTSVVLYRTILDGGGVMQSFLFTSKRTQRRSMISVCCICRRQRTSPDTWVPFDMCKDNSNAEFTHGFCPDCIREHYPHLSDMLDGL